VPDILITIAGVVVFGLIGLAGWQAWKLLAALLRGIFQMGSAPTELTDADSSPNSMNEGDYHSGPGGYEPNTAYPDTHYGDLGRDE